MSRTISESPSDGRGNDCTRAVTTPLWTARALLPLCIRQSPCGPTGCSAWCHPQTRGKRSGDSLAAVEKQQT